MSKKKLRKNTQRKQKIIIAICVGLFVALITHAVIGAVSRARAQKHETAMFTELSNKLTSLTSEVQASSGTPTQQKIESYCYRSSVKFGEGELFCGIKSGANFTIDSVPEAAQLGNAILEKVSSQSNALNLRVDYETNLSDRWFKEVSFRMAAADKLPDISCSLKLSYLSREQPSTSPIIPFPGETAAHTLGYLINCTHGASKEYFPMS